MATNTDEPNDEFPAPDEMGDTGLTGEIETLARYERSDGLTAEQSRRLTALRDEMIRRASVAGPSADYDGPEADP